MHKLSCFIIWIFLLLTGCHSTHIQDASELVKCELVNVVDGDTLTVMYDNEIANVRLIGIDTPESVHVDTSKNNEFGEMASNYTKQLLDDIEYVYLEFDTSMYDDYDRLLAYVYFSDNPTFEESLNYNLVISGYALNKEFAPNTRYAAQLDAACEDAERNERGLWEIEAIKDVIK